MKVLRYEIKNINPPKDVLHAMEKQMRAEREKRAVVLTSEGDRDAKINQAEGEKQRVIKESEANKQQQINEAQGQAEAILAVATATAEGLRRVGDALAGRGGMEAMQLRVAEEYVKQFGKLADEASSTLIVPANAERYLVDDRDGDECGEAADEGVGLKPDLQSHHCAQQPADDSFEVREGAALVDLVAVRRVVPHFRIARVPHRARLGIEPDHALGCCRRAPSARRCGRRRSCCARRRER